MAKEKQGFTLIELIIYLAVFVILITAVTLFAMDFIKAAGKSRIKKEVSWGARSAMERMIHEIKRATSVYAPTSVFNAHPGQLSLETAEALPNEEQTTYVDFYLDNDNKLYTKRENQQPQLLISGNLRVTNLEFEYFASLSESIKINLAITYNSTAPEYQYSYGLSSSATIRK